MNENGLSIGDIRRAVNAAGTTLRSVDDEASTMAGLLTGRLRQVHPGIVADIKREVTQFNASTGKWRN